jgi:hypothetical protein
MLTVLGTPRRCCDGVTRRETLQAGALALLGGFGLPQLLQAEQEGHVRPRRRARSVIVLYLLGGAATQDMVDLKPTAPAEVRGEFRPIATRVPGIQVCEHLPRMARWTHRLAIVRSLNHRAGCHNPLPSYTGYAEPVTDLINPRDTYPPSMGSVCESLRRRGGDLPDYVYLPCYLGWGQAIRRPGPYAGFLGSRFDPLFTECDPFKHAGTPAARPGFPQVVRGEPRLPQTGLAAGITADRLNSRRSLLGQIDDGLLQVESQPTLGNHSRIQQRAFTLLTSSPVRAAFDLSQECPRLRDRYGRTLFGSSTLIARRLVEAGVRFVNVTWDLFWDRVPIDYDCWDTHTRNFAILRDNNLPQFDQTYSALLEDLEDRGLLDETLVVVLSEMGRTPRVNANAGRDHWTLCYSTWLAGGGVRGGTVYGASDAQAAYVRDRPVSPADVCATIYECLGIDPEMTVPDRSGRPIPVAHGGRPMYEVLT